MGRKDVRRIVELVVSGWLLWLNKARENRTLNKNMGKVNFVEGITSPFANQLLIKRMLQRYHTQRPFLGFGDMTSETA